MRLVTYIAPVAAMLAAMGCSSTLEEYRCEVEADCAGEMVGRCEPSGHCSFADEECTSGFRFGRNSGDESDSCVGGGDPPDPVIDAGPGLAPIARIREFAVPCGQSSASLSAIDSEALGGRSLTEFFWRLLGPEDQLLDSFAGPPGQQLRHGIHRLGGSYLRPEINATTYEGRKGIRADFTEDALDTSSLQYPIGEVLEPAGPTQDFILSFALGTLAESATGDLRITNDANVVLFSRSFAPGPGMQPFQFSVDSIPSSSIVAPVTIQFSFDTSGTYWVDNMSLVHLSSNLQLISNGSVESTANPWVFGPTPVTLTPASKEDIPQSSRQPGIYTIELQVTDSGGDVSATDEVQFEIAECGP